MHDDVIAGEVGFTCGDDNNNNNNDDDNNNNNNNQPTNQQQKRPKQQQGEQQRQQQQQQQQETTSTSASTAAIFNFCSGEAASLILDIGKKIVQTIMKSDVPLLRFTYYVYPCLSTAAPTVHAAAVLAEATKLHVPIPQGKSAAKIETHFTVRNNSGVSNNLVLDEIKKGFQEKLPMSKYFVTNQSGGSFRRQRQENNNNQPQRILNASVSYIVLHSAALLCIQPDFTENKEYALHKMGASFAESLN